MRSVLITIRSRQTALYVPVTVLVATGILWHFVVAPQVPILFGTPTLGEVIVSLLLIALTTAMAYAGGTACRLVTVNGEEVVVRSPSERRRFLRAACRFSVHRTASYGRAQFASYDVHMADGRSRIEIADYRMVRNAEYAVERLERTLGVGRGSARFVKVNERRGHRPRRPRRRRPRPKQKGR